MNAPPDTTTENGDDLPNASEGIELAEQAAATLGRMVEKYNNLVKKAKAVENPNAMRMLLLASFGMKMVNSLNQDAQEFSIIMGAGVEDGVPTPDCDCPRCTLIREATVLQDEGDNYTAPEQSDEA